MRSTCPDCLSQVEHPHGESQVICTSCGSTYSPFLTPGESPDFSESASAFQEIVDFGHTLDQGSSSPKSPVQLSPPTQEAKGLESSSESISFILTTHDLGSQYLILQWFTPIVRMVMLEDDTSPLEKALKGFQEIALGMGANAVTGIRCSLAPDNKRALLMGTPVKCEKKQSLAR